MKKESIVSILIYLLVFAVAIIYGFTVLQTHFANSSFKEVWMYALYIVVSVIAGVLASGLLTEMGHLLGAKAGGYKVVSFCLFYFTIYVDKEGKRKFKLGGYDGLTGETKIIPNYEKKEKPNPYPFLLNGTVFNIAWIVACLFLFFTYKNIAGIESDVAYFFLTCAVINSLALIYNIIPAKFDSMTDGYRLSQIKGDVVAFNERLAAENGGVIPENKKDNSSEETIKKPLKFIPEVAFNEIFDLLVKKDYDAVFNKVEEINSHEKECSNKLLLEAKSQYIYAYILSKDPKEVEEYYEKEIPFSLRKDFSNDNSMPVIRTYLLLAGLLENSQSEVMLSLGKVVKAYRNVPNNRKHQELTLFNETLDKIIEAHPKWEEINNYKLYE